MESVLKSFKISNVLNPRGFRIPNCDQKGFYKKKQVISFYPEYSSFLPHMLFMFRTLNQLQGLAPIRLSVLLKGKSGVLFLGRPYLRQNTQAVCYQARSLNHTTALLQDDSSCHGDHNNSIGKARVWWGYPGGGLFVCACWYTKTCAVSSINN